MSTKVTIGLCMAAALFGGIVSHYIWPSETKVEFQKADSRDVPMRNVGLVDSKGNKMGLLVLDGRGGTVLVSNPGVMIR